MRWNEPQLNGYDKIDLDDFLTALPDTYRSDNRPLLVYVSSDVDAAAKKTEDVEQNVFRDENVALGARLFSAIEVNGDKITKSSPWAQALAGRELPRVIVLDAAGQRVAAVEGNDLSASSVFKHMKKAASKSFKTDLAKVVKDSRSLLDQMDQLDAKLKVLAEQKKTANEAKEKQLAAEEAKLSQQLTDVQVREADLFERVNQERKVSKS